MGLDCLNLYMKNYFAMSYQKHNNIKKTMGLFH